MNPSTGNISTDSSRNGKDPSYYPPKPAPRDRLITLAEARLKHRLSVRKMYQWAHEGVIMPVARDGRQTYYLEREIDSVVATGKSPYPSWFKFIEGRAS